MELALVYLHSTMFLLIRRLSVNAINKLFHLHSTMFLLILDSATGVNPVEIFTFHNVSINTTNITCIK